METTVSSNSVGQAPLRLVLSAVVRALDPVTIDASSGGYNEYLDRSGYYRRMAHAIDATFITSQQLTQRNPTEITQMLRNVSGVRIVSMGGMKRGVKNSVPLGRGGLCVLGLVVDGKRVEFEAPSVEAIQPRIPAMVNGRRVSALNDPSSGIQGTIDELVPPSMVAAIEVYPSAASVPNELQHHVHACGLIVVWTKFD